MAGTNKENGNSAFGGAVQKTIPRRGLAKVSSDRKKRERKNRTGKISFIM